MHRRLGVLLAITSALLVTACGDPASPTIADGTLDVIAPTIATSAEDAIAFQPHGESGVAVMAPDGTLLDLVPEAVKADPWPERDQVISQVCGSWDVLPILLVSPDGLVLGPPKPDWLPAMSPCGIGVS